MVDQEGLDLEVKSGESTSSLLTDYEGNADGNNSGNLLPYMIHCTWSKKGPEKLHQPARFWGVLWTYKWGKKGSVIMKDCQTTDI